MVFLVNYFENLKILITDRLTDDLVVANLLMLLFSYMLNFLMH